MVIGHLSIFFLGALFLVYLLGHIYIGYMLKQKEKKLSLNLDNIELQKDINILKILFKWFPAIAVIIIIIILLRS